MKDADKYYLLIVLVLILFLLKDIPLNNSNNFIRNSNPPKRSIQKSESTINQNTFNIIISAFAGGFFAAFFTNVFESQRRKNEKRNDKYFDHRNTLVQIEHELSPIRLNLSRNLASLSDALENTNSSKVRVILRLYKLEITRGLSTKLLNLELINKYLDVSILLETINSDIIYLSELLIKIQKERNPGLLHLYTTQVAFLLDTCKKVDQKSMELLSMCRLALREDDQILVKSYIELGGLINYSFSKEILKKENTKVESEENRPYEEGEKRPKFVSSYLDIIIS